MKTPVPGYKLKTDTTPWKLVSDECEIEIKPNRTAAEIEVLVWDEDLEMELDEYISALNEGPTTCEYCDNDGERLCTHCNKLICQDEFSHYRGNLVCTPCFKEVYIPKFFRNNANCSVCNKIVDLTLPFRSCDGLFSCVEHNDCLFECKCGVSTADISLCSDCNHPLCPSCRFVEIHYGPEPMYATRGSGTCKECYIMTIPYANFFTNEDFTPEEVKKNTEERNRCLKNDTIHFISADIEMLSIN